MHIPAMYVTIFILLYSVFADEVSSASKIQTVNVTSDQSKKNLTNVNINELANKEPAPVASAASSDSASTVNASAVQQKHKETMTFLVNNISNSDICKIPLEQFNKITSVYPHNCLDEAAEVDFIANSSKICSESADLPAKGAAEQEHLSSLSIFLILCILGMCVLMIFCLLKTKLQILPESVACVIVGAVIGLVLKILSWRGIADWQKEEAFSPTIFFLVFLPPIIFESGYNLHKGNFFQNIGSILTFAILGTIISALVIGGGIYLLGVADLVFPLTFVESFAFGSLISAVDPVATLALFGALQVDPVLHMLVFGESILNDAVSIVLTTSVLEMSSYEGGAGEAMLHFVWRFCVMFLGSAGIGVAFGLLSAVTLKHVAIRDYTSLELCLLLIFIYAPYALAEGIHLSGIMAILFGGVVMSHYTHYNLSPVLQITVQHLMRTLSFSAECIVFIYLGMAIFSFKHQFHFALVCWSIVLCLFARAVNIFPLSWAVNKFRDHPITPKMMFVMWFSGLRGAIAYALALHLEFSDEKRHVIVTTTLVIVLFTIFVLGGSVVPLVKYGQAEVRSKKDLRKQRKKQLTMSKTREWGQPIDSEHLSEFTEDEGGESSGSLGAGSSLPAFVSLDRRYLRAFFCRNMTHQEVRSHANNLKRQCYESLNFSAIPSDSEEELFPN